MKTVKLSITALLILIALTISGDLFQDYLSNFEYKFDYTNFSLPFKVNSKEMTEEITQQAKNNNVKFFTIQRKFSGISHNTVYIYCSDMSVIQNIKEECKIEEKNYDSVFFGKTTIEADLFVNSAEELLSGTYFLIGSTDDMYNFKMSLMEKYGGGLIRDGYEPKNDTLLIAFLWMSVFIVFTLLSIFEYLIKIKEYSVNIIMGFSPIKLVVKDLTIDIFFVVISYMVFKVLINDFTNTYFCQGYHYVFLALIILADIVIHYQFLSIRIKDIFKDKKYSKGLLTSCYITKYVSTVLTIVLIATNLLLISEGISWRSQNKYWTNYFDYNQMSARYVKNDGNFNENESLNLKVNYNAYSSFFNTANVTLMSSITEKDFFGQSVIAYNKNSYDYLRENIKSVDFENLKDNKIYAFLPEKYYKNNFSNSQISDLNHIANYLIDWDGNYKKGVEIVFYDDNIKLLALKRNTNFESSYYKNPIVLFVNIDEELFPRINTGDDNIGSNTYFTIYNMSKESFETFFENNCPEGYSVQIFFANVGEQYQYKLSVAEKGIFINTFLVVLFFILSLSITILTLRLDYNLNAAEIAVKKIMGYTLFQRQKKLLLGSFLCSMLSIGATVLYAYIFKSSLIIFVLLSGISFIFVDLILILVLIKKIEKEQITKILKGGAL